MNTDISYLVIFIDHPHGYGQMSCVRSNDIQRLHTLSHYGLLILVSSMGRSLSNVSDFILVLGVFVYSTQCMCG